MIWDYVFMGLTFLVAIYAAFFRKIDKNCNDRIKRIENTSPRVLEGDGEKIDCILKHPTREKIIYTLLKKEK